MIKKLQLITDYLNLKQEIHDEFNIKEYDLLSGIQVINDAELIDIEMYAYVISFKIEYLGQKSYLRERVSLNKEYNTDKWKITNNTTGYPYKVDMITTEENCLFVNYAGGLTCFIFEENDINFNKLKMELTI